MLPIEHLVIEQWPLARFRPYERALRVHDQAVEPLARAIGEFGFRVPMLARSDGTVVDGHLRLKAALHLGLQTIPVLLADDLSEVQIRAFRLSVNKMADLAQWDASLLIGELQALEGAGFDLTLTGFAGDELHDLLHADDGNPGLTELDAAPDLEPEPVSAPGDLWLLGPHRLLCGDATQPDAVARVMQGEHADLWLTDPPYGVAYTGGPNKSGTTRKPMANDLLAGRMFHDFLAASFKAASSVLRPGASFYIWHADGLVGLHFRTACQTVGWTVRQSLIWVKSSATLGRQDYQWIHEAALYGWMDDDPRLYDEAHAPCLYGWQDGAGHAWNNDRKQTTVQHFERPSRSDEHPTMKPVAMFEYQLRNSTRPGAAVLDSFAGSGTTLIAAEHSGRVARLIELDPAYVDVIVRRWQAFTGQKAVRESDAMAFDVLAEIHAKSHEEAAP